jgi:hypothetical protein
VFWWRSPEKMVSKGESTQAVAGLTATTEARPDIAFDNRRGDQMKRVFLSFRVEDKKQVDGVRLLAANDNFDIEFYDESVRVPINSQNADYIKTKIREKISRSTVTVCLMSAYTHASDWVNWEIEESYKSGNTVIFMGLPGHPQNMQLPASAKPNTGWWIWDHNQLAKLISEA